MNKLISSGGFLVTLNVAVLAALVGWAGGLNSSLLDRIAENKRSAEELRIARENLEKTKTATEGKIEELRKLSRAQEEEKAEEKRRRTALETRIAGLLQAQQAMDGEIASLRREVVAAKAPLEQKIARLEPELEAANRARSVLEMQNHELTARLRAAEQRERAVLASLPGPAPAPAPTPIAALEPPVAVFGHLRRGAMEDEIKIQAKVRQRIPPDPW